MSDMTNLVEFYNRFATEQDCRDYLEKMRWNGKIACPHCGVVGKSYKYKDGRLFKCRDCQKQFTVRVGTIFEDSKLPLQKWFLAVYLATSLKKGISSIQLSKYLGVTQKTAWFMLHRIRHAVETTDSNNDKFSGIIEADETYMGGRRKQSVAYDNKTAVVGVAEKRGRVKIKTFEGKANADKVLPFLDENVERLSVLHTDESNIYHWTKVNYKHRTVDHGIGHYVEKNVHTNNLESFWSHLKNGIKAINIHVSPKHLQRYCDEYQYRYNTRSMTDGQRFNDWFSRVNGRLEYKELTQ